MYSTQERRPVAQREDLESGESRRDNWTHDSALGRLGDKAKGRTLKARHGSLNQMLLEQSDQVGNYED